VTPNERKTACGTCFGCGFISDGYNTINCSCEAGLERERRQFESKVAEDRAVTPNERKTACGTCFGCGFISDGYNTINCSCEAGLERERRQFESKVAEDRAVTAPQEPEIQGLRDMLRLQMSLKDDYLRLADKYGEKLSALTHAVEALRGEMEQLHDAMAQQSAMTTSLQVQERAYCDGKGAAARYAAGKLAAILKEWEGQQ
jgi:hypothetical protein